MTVHRFVYKCCWKNRFILPLLVIIAFISIISLLLPNTSLEYVPGGKIRFKYHAASSVVDVGLMRTVAAYEGFVSKESPEVRVVKSGDILKIVDENEQGTRIKQLSQNHDLPKLEMKHDLGNSPNNIADVVGQGMVRDFPEAKREPLEELQKKVEQHRISHQLDLAADKGVTRKHLGRNRKKTRLKFKPVWKREVYYNTSNPPELFKTWDSYVDRFCDDQFIGYFNEFSYLKNIVIDKNYILSERVGGEKLKQVMNQSEESEYFTYELGAFELNCPKRPTYYFNNNNHLNDWLYSMKTKNTNVTDVDSIRTEFIIAIVRYEYVNIYHSMSDWYNAFLLMQYFKRTQWDTNVILFDAHPQGSLDSTWLVLFNTTQRLHMLPQRTLFTNIVWNILGYNSPMLDHYGPGMPLIEEFRDFILTSFNIQNGTKLNCAELNILFLWRHDYVAHPRNPSGMISRKILNERDLMKSIQEKYPSYKVRGMQIDLFDIQKQLAIVSQTDIMIGMHGAGLTHSLFLPTHAGVIELIPSYWSTANDHFYAISKWRNLVYERWTNEDPRNEFPNQYTTIPVGVMHSLVKSVIKKMCYKQQ